MPVFPLDDLSRRLQQLLADLLPPELSKDLPKDLQARLGPALEGLLSQLQLVPRAEFQQQQAQLARLQAYANALEARLAALEAGSASPAQPVD